MDPQIMNQPSNTDLAEIQGLVYSGWLDHPFAGYLFARLGPDVARSRAWLAAISGEVTPAARERRPRDGRLQLAISATGLAALGVPADVIGALPIEAQVGMAARRRALADPDPDGWSLGGPSQRLDVLVMVYARDAGARQLAMEVQRARLRAAGATVHADELSWAVRDREHFGFADGLSQPFLAGLHGAPRPGEVQIATGEVLLGYPNAYGQLPQSPSWEAMDLGRNGTFLVFRKLAQDVAAFWHWIAGHAARLAGNDPTATRELTELLGAKLVGRWRSGAPLVLSPDRDDPAFASREHRNAFKFLKQDPYGLRCPITSHVRRANPRDARGGTAEESEAVVDRHRILRRGRSYGAPLNHDDACAGKDDGGQRGLYFICLQSSIARGFEFIQQTWLANPGFGGLRDEPDLIISDDRPRSSASSHVTIPAEPVRFRLSGAPRVVRHEGGGYFLLPSIAALAFIAAAGR